MSTLEIFGKQVFGLEKIAYRWSAQDLITLDKIPYIGEITSDQKHINCHWIQKMGYD